MESAAKPRKSMVPFMLVIAANLVSLTGSQMTRFAVVYWAWQISGSATAAGLIAVCGFAGTVVASAFAGALVDRWNRKRTIIATDIVSGISTGALLLLYMTGNLEVWHLGVVGAVAGILESLQFPAYMSAVTTMVTPEQYARANGMFQFVWQGSQMAAPVLAAGVIATLGMTSVFVIDMLSFLAVVAAVGLVSIPQPEASGEQHDSIWQEIAAGFRYIWERPSLLGLLLVVLVANIACGAYEGVFRPMVLARTGDSAATLAQALLWVGIGGVVGGLVMSAWGGPRGRAKVQVILVSMGAMFIGGLIAMGLAQTLLVWAMAGFAYGFFLAVANTLIFALWQQKVEPAMVAGGALATLFGALVGTGKGAGMGLVLSFSGLFGVVAMIAGFLWPAVRQAEEMLPDHSEQAA